MITQKITVKTNNQERELKALCELTEEEAKDFDYIEEDERFTSRLFKYKGVWYDVNEFTAFRLPWGNPNSPLAKEWDSSQPDSYFSGVVIRYPRDESGEVETNYIIVGTYYC